LLQYEIIYLFLFEIHFVPQFLYLANFSLITVIIILHIFFKKINLILFKLSKKIIFFFKRLFRYFLEDLLFWYTKPISELTYKKLITIWSFHNFIIVQDWLTRGRICWVPIWGTCSTCLPWTIVSNLPRDTYAHVQAFFLKENHRLAPNHFTNW
jgi:hypothetical protein